MLVFHGTGRLEALALILLAVLLIILDEPDIMMRHTQNHVALDVTREWTHDLLIVLQDTLGVGDDIDERYGPGLLFALV